MVTLNADMGESFGIHSFGHDDDLAKVIDLANVACGFHAGDPTGMSETVDKLKAAGARIGAHPGLPDLVGFGRREISLHADELTDLVRYQVGALVAFLDAAGVRLSHIKPHGALYGMTSKDAELMHSICDVAEQYDVAIIGLSGTKHETITSKRRLRFISEFYVDLSYDDSGSLMIPRRIQPTSPELAAARARLALEEGVLQTLGGKRLRVNVDSICVHADSAHASEVARSVRAVIDDCTKEIG